MKVGVGGILRPRQPRRDLDDTMGALRKLQPLELQNARPKFLLDRQEKYR